ncbi:MAG: nuclear transport factor 2 family protein [Pseudobacter sp.]|uniref:nuclear transport factor 2 family protein n=1 Tax=Pseudobacter sp. TaxID=2045420 RepID=UPI003F7EBCB1
MQNNQNKQTVLSFYKNVIASREVSVIPAFIHPEYIQHSPQLKDGLSGLREAILTLQKMPVQKQDQSPVKLVLASGDLVGMYMLINMQGKWLAVADLFRLEDGLIVEHWDAVQELEQAPDQDALVVQEDLAGQGHPLQENAAEDHIEEDLVNLFRNENRIVHRIIMDGNYALGQSSGTKDGCPFVFYEFLLLDGRQVKKRFSIEQEIPAVSANKNGMI